MTRRSRGEGAGALGWGNGLYGHDVVRICKQCMSAGFHVSKIGGGGGVSGERAPMPMGEHGSWGRWDLSTPVKICHGSLTLAHPGTPQGTELRQTIQCHLKVRL